MNKHHVIIVGAGICGLTCAKTLVSYGVNVTILEADKQSGGNIRETNLANTPIELGPQCFLTPHTQGASNLILIQMLNQAKIPYQILDFNAHNIAVYQKDGTPIDTLQLSEHFLNAEQALHIAFEEAKNFSENISLKEALGYLDSPCHAINRSTERTIINLWLNHIYGLSINKTPALCEKNSRLMHVNQHALILPQAPLSHVIDTLISQISHLAQQNDCLFTLLHNQAVTAIDYQHSNSVAIQTHSGTVMGNAAIVTVPHAILKSHNISFTPDLPKEKQTAISNLNTATVEKVILPYNVSIPSSKPLIAIETSHHDRPMLFYNLKQQYPHQPNILMRVLTYKKNTNTSVRNPQKLILESHRAISRCLNLKLKDLNKDEAFIYNPQSAPHLAGSITSHATNHSSQHALRLRKSLHPLYFSGEATHAEKYGTIQGAIESGHHSAMTFLTKIQGHHKKKSA